MSEAGTVRPWILALAEHSRNQTRKSVTVTASEPEDAMRPDRKNYLPLLPFPRSARMEGQTDVAQTGSCATCFSRCSVDSNPDPIKDL